MECDVTNPDANHAILILEPKSLRPFKTRDEYMYAMKEDLAEWFFCLYQLDINVNNFFEQLETGVTMCKHANFVHKFTRDAIENGGSNTLTEFVRIFHIPIEIDIPFFAWAKPRTFQARDNVSNFISWCRSLGIPQVLLFETDDLVLRKNERSVVLCLLEMARVGAKLGMLAPQIVQLEAEIDAEIEGRADPPPQIKTCDLRSLDEMVRDLVGICSCPSQFPIIKVCEGKYKVGVSESLIFVRILRKHVMVRVGGGWDTLAHYLDKHDPCRCHYMGHRFAAMGGVRSKTPGVPEKRTPKTTRSQSVCANPIQNAVTSTVFHNTTVHERRNSNVAEVGHAVVTDGNSIMVERRSTGERNSDSLERNNNVTPVRNTNVTDTKTSTVRERRSSDTTEYNTMESYKQRYKKNKNISQTSNKYSSKAGSENLSRTKTPVDIDSEHSKTIAKLSCDSKSNTLPRSRSKPETLVDHIDKDRSYRSKTPTGLRSNSIVNKLDYVSKYRSKTPTGIESTGYHETSLDSYRKMRGTRRKSETDTTSDDNANSIGLYEPIDIRNRNVNKIVTKLKPTGIAKKLEYVYSTRTGTPSKFTSDHSSEKQNDISSSTTPLLNNNECTTSDNLGTTRIPQIQNRDTDRETKPLSENISGGKPALKPKPRTIVCRKQLPFGLTSAPATSANSSCSTVNNSNMASESDTSPSSNEDCSNVQNSNEDIVNSDSDNLPEEHSADSDNLPENSADSDNLQEHSAEDGWPGEGGRRLRISTIMERSIECEPEPEVSPKMDDTGQINIDEISTMSLAQFKSLLNTALAIPGESNTTADEPVSKDSLPRDSTDNKKTNVKPVKTDSNKREYKRPSSPLRTKNGYNYAVPRARSTPPVEKCVSSSSSENNLDRDGDRVSRPRRTLPSAPSESNSDVVNKSANQYSERGRSLSRPGSARAVTPGAITIPVTPTSIPRPKSPSRPITPSAIPRPSSAKTRPMSVDRLNRSSDRLNQSLDYDTIRMNGQNRRSTQSGSSSDVSIPSRQRSRTPSSVSPAVSRPQSRPSSPGPRKLSNSQTTNSNPNITEKSRTLSNSTYNNQPETPPTNRTKRPGSATRRVSAPTRPIDTPDGSNEKLNDKTSDANQNTSRKQSTGSAAKIIASRKTPSTLGKENIDDNNQAKGDIGNRGRARTREIDSSPRTRPKSAGPRFLPKPKEECLMITRTEGGQHVVQMNNNDSNTKSAYQRRASTGVRNVTDVKTYTDSPTKSLPRTYRQLPKNPIIRPQSARSRSMSRDNSSEEVNKTPVSPVNESHRQIRPGSAKSSDKSSYIRRPGSAKLSDKSNTKYNTDAKTNQQHTTNNPRPASVLGNEKSTNQRRRLPSYPRRAITPNSYDYEKDLEPRSLSEIQDALGLTSMGNKKSSKDDVVKTDEKMFKRMEFLFEKYRQKELKDSVQAAYENRPEIVDSEDSETAYTAEDEASLDSYTNKKSDDDDMYNLNSTKTCVENVDTNGLGKTDMCNDTTILSQHELTTTPVPNCNYPTDVTLPTNHKPKVLLVSSRERKSSSSTSDDNTPNQSVFINHIKQFNKQMSCLPSSKTPTISPLESRLGYDKVTQNGSDQCEYSSTVIDRQDSVASLSDASHSSSTSGCRSETPVPKLSKPLTTGRSTLLVKKDRSGGLATNRILLRSVSAEPSTSHQHTYNGYFQSSSSSIDEDASYF